MNLLAFEKTRKNEALKIRLLLLGIIFFGFIALNITPVEVVLNFFKGSNIFERVPNTCLMINIFGIPCPLCGMSRGFHELTQLNFSGGIHYNPFSVVFYPAVMLIISAVFFLSFLNYKIRIINRRYFWSGMFFLFIVVWTANILWGHH